MPKTDFQLFVDNMPGYTRFRNVTHLWESMDNVVVVIPGKTTQSMLISAHYDTVSLSSGATDNSAAVSVLLEVISILSDQKPYYTLIFAFIQGEEIGLLGAAALAEFSPLFRNVSYFLNLDGTPGDKSMNFRSSGGLLDTIYAHVNHPLGFVTAMDIFNLKLIGSDTDWSVYNRYASGLDYATFSKRQTYHTLKDTVITEGSIQFLGDNVLSLIRKTVFEFQPHWNGSNPREPHIFFSIFNLIHVVYSMDMAFWLHITAISILGGILIIHIFPSSFALGTQNMSSTSKSHAQEETAIKSILFGIMGTVLTAVLAILFSSCFSFVSSLYAQMYAYTRASYAVGALIFPSLSGICLAQWIMVTSEGGRISAETSQNRNLWGLSYTWLIIGLLTIKSATSIGSTYFLTFFILSSAIVVVLHAIFKFCGILHQASPNEIRKRRHYIHVAEESEELHMDSRMLPVKLAKRAISEKTEILAWLILFIIGFAPSLFIFEILIPLMELAIGALGAFVFGPLIAIATFFCVSWFLPLSRRSGHYGTLFIIFIILSFITFIPITLHGRSTFNEKYPFVMEPRQVEEMIELRPYFPYTVSLFEMSNILDSSKVWNCEANRICKAPNPSATKTSSKMKCSNSGRVEIVMSTPGAWMHNITFENGDLRIMNLELNGINMAKLERNFNLQTFADPDYLLAQSFRFYLNSAEHTNSWTIAFDVVTHGGDSKEEREVWSKFKIHVESIWAEASSVLIMEKWIKQRPTIPSHVMYADQHKETHLPDWMSFVGNGMRGVASLTQTIKPIVCSKNKL
jgi:hypothetical protein